MSKMKSEYEKPRCWVCGKPFKHDGTEAFDDMCNKCSGVDNERTTDEKTPNTNSSIS